MKRRRSLPALAVVWLVAFPPLAFCAVEYSLSYSAMPAKINYMEWDLTTGEGEQHTDSMKFGTAGFRVGIGLPQSLGPISPGVETGFALPMGRGMHDHRRTVRNPPVGASPNDTNEGDVTYWQVMTVPFLFTLRYDPPSPTVSLGGQLGFGPIFLGISQELVDTVYSGPVPLFEWTENTQRLAVAFGVELGVGLVIPATQDLSVNLLGGAMWMSKVAHTETYYDFLTTPLHPQTRTYGMELGGLGLTFRVSLRYGV